jgi:hypothetical protein
MGEVQAATVKKLSKLQMEPTMLVHPKEVGI